MFSFKRAVGAWIAMAFLFAATLAISAEPKRPNIVLVMADDMGYAQTGYFSHPLLKTPGLDRLAADGLRLDRFYAASAVCSPTRASVLTGRSPERTGVPSHGYALRLQEHSVVEAIRKAGYATGHFGKWHLNGLRGPGVPLLTEDRFHPGRFGFDTWLSVSNFFDRDPILSRRGKFESHVGDSSEIIVDEMLDFASRPVRAKQPFFAIIWYGTPHVPFMASPKDIESLVESKDEAEQTRLQQIFDSMDPASRTHYGELVAMDRSLATLRKGLQDLDVLDDTLIWFCSDNGGLPQVKPSSTTPLRGHKGQLHEGGLRVPCVLHWPAGIEAGRVSRFPACTTDIAPTIADLLQLPAESLLSPVDGISLMPILSDPSTENGLARKRPIGFRYAGSSAVIDNQWKLIRENKQGRGNRGVEQRLHHLNDDVHESIDASRANPEIVARLSDWLDTWNESVDESIAGANYASGTVNADHPAPRVWTADPRYRVHFDAWRNRPEYRAAIQRQLKND